MTPLRLGTRGSRLALWQARAVADALRTAGGPASDIVTIATSGDRQPEATLSDLGGKRVFVKEIEQALLAGTIDLAVHSAKDLPADLPDGLVVGGVLPREDPHDALVLPEGRTPASFLCTVQSLPQGIRVGTSSIRRAAQLTRLLPTAKFSDIRGNLETRLRKLDAGASDVLVLAVAGLRRLGYAHRVSATIPAEACLPSPGQGAIAVEVREDDATTRAAVDAISDRAAFVALTAERALVAGLGGGCHMPVGALALLGDGVLSVRGIVTSLDGGAAIRCAVTGSPDAAVDLGRTLADQLLEAGAADVLGAARAELALGDQRAAT
jgi:hydroxymethylbilane synthase